MDITIRIVEVGEYSDVSLISKICGFVEDKDEKLLYDFESIALKCFDYVQFSSSTFLMAFTPDNIIVGGCGIAITNGLHIDCLCVEPVLQGKGIGTAILNKATKIGLILNIKEPKWIDLVIPYKNEVFPLDQKKQITLEIDRYSPKYKKNVNFYTKNGFQIVILPGMIDAYCRKLI